MQSTPSLASSDLCREVQQQEPFLPSMTDLVRVNAGDIQAEVLRWKRQGEIIKHYTSYCSLMVKVIYSGEVMKNNRHIRSVGVGVYCSPSSDNINLFIYYNHF